jgi:hypothetical protein
LNERLHAKKQVIISDHMRCNKYQSDEK